jgi:hypothetical protein
MTPLIKINRKEYDNIYIASDFHYNHQRDFLWKPRGFKSYQEHDRFLEANIDTLTHNDLLIYLGDYSLNSTDEQTSNLLKRTQAQMFYIFGNHEGFHNRFYKNALENYGTNILNLPIVDFKIFPFSVDKYTGAGLPGIHKNTNNIVYFGEEGYFKIGNNNYFCRHMSPLIWDKMKHDNFFALAGHSHGNCSKLNIDSQEGRILDVGVDNALKHNGTAFFKVEEIDSIMSKKTIKIFDHHGDEHA